VSINTKATLNCDHHGCGNEIPYGAAVGTRAKDARAMGWAVNITLPDGTRLDYCPAHARKGNTK